MISEQQRGLGGDAGVLESFREEQTGFKPRAGVLGKS